MAAAKAFDIEKGHWTLRQNLSLVIFPISMNTCCCVIGFLMFQSWKFLVLGCLTLSLESIQYFCLLSLQCGFTFSKIILGLWLQSSWISVWIPRISFFHNWEVGRSTLSKWQLISRNLSSVPRSQSNSILQSCCLSSFFWAKDKTRIYFYYQGGSTCSYQQLPAPFRGTLHHFYRSCHYLQLQCNTGF